MAIEDRGNIIDCNCGGSNPNCQKCEGKGYYYESSEPTITKKQIARPPDPFPLEITELKDGDNKKSHIEQRLEKLAATLKRKKEKRMKRN